MRVNPCQQSTRFPLVYSSSFCDNESCFDVFSCNAVRISEVFGPGALVVDFNSRKTGRRFSFLAAVAGGAIALALLLAPFAIASTDHGIRGGREKSWCCCGCPPDRSAGRKCCCVPAGDDDAAAATDLPSSACDCSLGTSRGTDSAEFTAVSARKDPLPPGEFAFTIPSSSHPYGVVLSGQTFEDHFVEPPDPPPEHTILS